MNFFYCAFVRCLLARCVSFFPSLFRIACSFFFLLQEMWWWCCAHGCIVVSTEEELCLFFSAPFTIFFFISLVWSQGHIFTWGLPAAAAAPLLLLLLLPPRGESRRSSSSRFGGGSCWQGEGLLLMSRALSLRPLLSLIRVFHGRRVQQQHREQQQRFQAVPGGCSILETVPGRSQGQAKTGSFKTNSVKVSYQRHCFDIKNVLSV